MQPRLCKDKLPGKLNATGIAQAEEVARKMANDHIDVFISSDLYRSIRTCEIIALPHFQDEKSMKQAMITTPLIRERDWGDFTGKFIPSLPKDPKDWPDNIESIEKMKSRAQNFLTLAQGDLSRQNYSCRRTRHYQQGYSERLFQAPYERDRKDGKRRGKSSDLIICFYSPPYYIYRRIQTIEYPISYMKKILYSHLTLNISHLTVKNPSLMANKIALITGATSGIGEACARRFAQGGYDLILTGRNTGKLEIIKKELENAYGIMVLALAFDVRNREAARKAVDYIPSHMKNIDVLINNAGPARGLEPEYEGDFEDWDQMIDTNIKGLLTMTRLIVPGMVSRNHGHIINIGSVAGDAAYAGGNVYCATKAAVKAITDGLRIDVAHTKVRVTNVKPGLVETNFSNIRFHGDNARADRVYDGIVPLNGDDVADVAFYAASAPNTSG